MTSPDPDLSATRLHEVRLMVRAASHQDATQLLWDEVKGRGPFSPFSSVEHTRVFGVTCPACQSEDSTRERIVRIVNGEDLKLTPADVEGGEPIPDPRERAMELAISFAAYHGTGGISHTIKAAESIHAYLTTGTVPTNGES